ncbi:hypothetical protein BHE74_00030120 [Ensete ventricosum]|nr:hypothetical protein BHE74_00030120 [Ensete ventricosum]RZS23414.1 hypothetical protein BHM03_00056345 [Ensete ventricosum]
MTWPPTRGQPATAKAPYTGGDRLWPARRSDSRWRARPLKVRRSQEQPAHKGLLPIGAMVTTADKGSRHLRKGDGAVRVREEG